MQRLTPDLTCVSGSEAEDSLKITVQEDSKIIDTLLCFGLPYYAEGAWQTTGAFIMTPLFLLCPVSGISRPTCNRTENPGRAGPGYNPLHRVHYINASVPGGTYLWENAQKTLLTSSHNPANSLSQ